MKAAILQCDDVRDEFLAEFDNYPAMIKRMFEKIGENVELDTYNCQIGELPNEIEAYDFFITTGSKASVYDGHAWIDKLVRFIQLLDQKQKKLIGICFGHQLIAVARGLEVKKSPKGWGIGISDNMVVSRQNWMDSDIENFKILVSYQDQIVQIPLEIKIIAANDFCPYFVLQWSPHILSIQGHPEWVNGYSAALIKFRQSIIPEERIANAFASLNHKPDSELFTRWMMNFVRRS